MRNFVVALLATALMTGGVGAASGAVRTAPPPGNHTEAACGMSFSWKLREPTSMTPTRGWFRSTSGTFSCVDKVFGRTALGTAGRLVVREAYGPDTCLSGGGAGPFRASIPTARGTIRVRGFFSERRAGLLGTISATVIAGRRRARMTGTYAVFPNPGQDCFTKPVTGGSVSSQAALRG